MFIIISQFISLLSFNLKFVEIHAIMGQVEIMSNVAIKAEVIQTSQLFVSLDVGHYYISILLVRPLLAKQLV